MRDIVHTEALLPSDGDFDILTYYFVKVQASLCYGIQTPITHAALFASKLDEDELEDAGSSREEVKHDLGFIFTELSSPFMGTTSVADVVRRRFENMEEHGIEAEEEFDDY